MNYYTELGVKGFCFRAFPDNAVVANMVKSCGLDRIDLSGPQLDFRNPSLHAPAIRAYAEAGVKIVGIGVVGLSGGVDDEELFCFCRSAGCRTISINGEPGTFYEALKQAEAWAGKYDMRLAIHNHGGNHWLGNSQMLRHVLSRCGERVGIRLVPAGQRKPDGVAGHLCRPRACGPFQGLRLCPAGRTSGRGDRRRSLGFACVRREAAVTGIRRPGRHRVRGRRQRSSPGALPMRGPHAELVLKRSPLTKSATSPRTPSQMDQKSAIPQF